MGLRSYGVARLVTRLGGADESQRWVAASIASLLLLALLVGGEGSAGALYWSLSLLLLWIPTAEWMGLTLGGKKLHIRVGLVVLFVLLSFPATINYMNHYRKAPVRRLHADDVQLAASLQARAEPGNVVLYNPNRGRIAPSLHLAHLPGVLCYFGRTGTYSREMFEERAQDVLRALRTKAAREAYAIIIKHEVRWLLVEKRRPLPFGVPVWLEQAGEGEAYILYRVSR